MAQKPSKKKDIVTVGRLKEVLADLEKQNFDLSKMVELDGPEDVDNDMLKKISVNSSMINKYKKMIANPAKYKPRK